jgi:hypothetical protein
MKKVVLLILFLLSVGSLFAQLQERIGVKSVIGAAASQKDNLNLRLTQTRNGLNGTFTIKSVSMQVGLPYMGVTNVTQTNNPSQYYKMDLGFPWGIRYRYSTFSEDAFTVSKGYYTDKVAINWQIKANLSLISDFIIYRSTEISSSSPNWGNPIATLSSSARSFDDRNIEGGKLYIYKVVAIGVEAVQNIYSSYIVGIGYRNPTAVITGNVSFNSGTPVKNVLISASPTGSEIDFGTSLKIPFYEVVNVNRFHKVLKDSLTLQGWVKPETIFDNDEVNVFQLRSNLDQAINFKVKLGVVNTLNTLTLTIEAPLTGTHVVTLSDYIPNGDVDNKGDDVLVPITDVNDSFTHFSAVLRNNQVPEIYINGRLISATYAATINSILNKNKTPGSTAPTVTFTSSNKVIPLNTSSTGAPQTWTQFKLGGVKTAYLDDIRVWETALTAAQIQTDFRRYLRGNEPFLHTYLTANENEGGFAYDLSSTGFDFHGNNAVLSTNSSFSNTIPTTIQLGILGVTDQFGNFVISAVPYTGNGNSYTIVPSLGKHKFNPNQQMVYIGEGSTVINNVNFKDVSSFSFKGIVVYDSRGVFPMTSDAPITGDIKDDEAYNAYVKGNLKYPKGEYWAEKNTAGVITSLRRYAPIPVPDAYVSIDNEPAIDANNVPIMTDINGRFTIQVPIGEHAITISKSGHEFLFDGRYPAKTTAVVGGQTVVTNTYQDFYEDRDEPITFIDNTKVTVIGRVVGGAVQADQVIGFGDIGKKTHTYLDDNKVSKSIDYTSVNNIGQATLTLGHLPAGATSVTPEYKTTIITNIQTGEFRKKLLPLSYNLSKNDVVFKNGKNPGNAPLLDQDKVINFTAINASTTPTFTQGKTTINGAPYQEILKFTYTAAPQFNILSQSSDTQITADGKTYTIASTQETPIYSQFGDYQIQIKGVENYYNHDNSVTNPVVSTVAVTGGEIMATNNLALENSEKTETSATDPSVLIYSFTGGTPNTDVATKYKRNINLSYRLNGIDYPLTGFKNEGILLGGVSDGTQSFVTAGPELPDFVLRDPPGSGSSATIDKGSSFTFSKESSIALNNVSDAAGSNSLGSTLQVGVGVINKTEIIADISLGLSMEQSSSDGKSVENTYTFNQSISTSDDPNWVGSDADLYIGYSANQIYGTFNKLTATTTQNGSAPIKVVPLANTTVTVVYPTVNTGMYFNEAPEKTFFIYSQRSIINDLIPKYELFVNKIKDGSLIENTNGVLSKNDYLSSINLWKKIILNNELAKYKAYNDRDQLKASLNSILDGLKNPATNLLPPAAKDLKNLLNATFFENISLDAGVGGITKSYQVDRIISSSYSYELQIATSVGLALGAKNNDTGATFETSTSVGGGKGESSSDQSGKTTNVSYTLSDTDDGNLLSVDAINAFDGNGPIFITKGGETSCPNEGAELSHYYNPTHLNATAVNPTIVALADADRTLLSVATVALEKPELQVFSSNNVTGLSEGRNAEFVLKLKNNSTVNKDATFLLVVDQTTNPDNALINIEPNGTLITIPAGQTVTYTMTLKKVKADQFNYNNIKVSLQSTCDDNASSSKFISAGFVPACSAVSVVSPSNNWLMNINTAYEGAIAKPLNIKLGDYNTTFSSFKQINLEYRLKGSPNWTGLKTYFKNQSDYTAAVTGGDNNVELIIGTELNYAWNIAGLGLSNGTYEIRARSTCTNNTVYESAIIQGIVDLTAPVVFGTPSPTNGILGLGNDIAIRFNEPVKLNGTVSQFLFEVQKNQLPVNHQVSLSFNGASNTATINKPYITTGDLSIEFWMKNSSPSGTSTLLSQSGGLKVELINDVLKYTLGGQSISATILKDGNFNHYTLSYNAAIAKLSIIENDKELTATTVPNPITTLSFTNSNPIVIGGNTFKGNIHDLRLWTKAITRDQSVANMNVALNGNENGIIGFWPINEGNGSIANDIARFKDLVILNANWDIFPKGTAYNFNGTSHLTTNSNTFSKVIISKEMDATVSFWMKTAQANVTLLSNGKGDGTDLVESNKFRNKWAFNTKANGGLELAAEGSTYAFGTMIVNDNAWHHVALSLTRKGALSLYIDGNQVGSYSTAVIGGIFSSNLFIGARGQVNGSLTNIDRYFVGQLDELCIWNMARTADQIKADMYFEQNYTNTGLLFYSNFNKPELANLNGPKYYYPFDAFSQSSDYFLLNGQALNFTDVTPAIKPFRPTERIVLNPIINGDEIIMVPLIENWASVEGKVANIVVSNLNDMYDNRQVSPVTWTAFINKNPIKMFVEGQGDIVNLVKTTNLPLTFQITVANQGGLLQPYSFTVPSWLKLSSTSGVLDPNKSTTITATVDMNLAPGSYANIISLTSNYGIDKKIQLNLRVLVNEPKLDFNPANFTQSMNIIAKIKVDGIISNDIYDKIYAFGLGTKGLEVRGKADLTYDAQLNTYNVFLTVYSSVVSGENISLFIWDASQGNFIEATLNASIAVPFVSDSVIGNFTNPAICENTNVSGQMVSLQQGWTWVSFNVNDLRFTRLNNLTAGADLSTSDLIQSTAPALFDSYQFYSTGSPSNGWSGTITSSGGITANKMYKIKIAKGAELSLKGIPVNLNTWSFNLLAGWNRLPYVANKNIPIGDALANLNPADGDLIKSQSLFAIYSSAARAWKGSLTYLNQSQGYMIKVANAQTLTYPAYINTVNSTFRHTNSIDKKELKIVGGKASIVSPLMGDVDNVAKPLSIDYSKFANTMNAVVKLPEGFNELYFYNDAHELRGNCKTINVEGHELAFITIYGEKAENLTAFIGSNNRNQQTSKTLKFASDVLLGAIAKPILIELAKQELSIYPNPFHDELKVVVDSKEKGETKIIIYSITGQTLFDKNFDLNAGTNVLMIQPKVPTGTYVMSVEVDGKVMLNKIIKD